MTKKITLYKNVPAKIVGINHKCAKCGAMVYENAVSCYRCNSVFAGIIDDYAKNFSLFT